MPVAEPTQPAPRMIVCHFIVSDDVERSARFYTEVLGGRVVFGPVPTNIQLANTYIIINGGGGPTDDKPTVTLATPSDPDRVQQFPQHPGHGYPCRLRRMDRPGSAIPDAAEAARLRDPLLHSRSRRLHHRGRADHRPKGRLVARPMAPGPLRGAIRLTLRGAGYSDPSWQKWTRSGARARRSLSVRCQESASAAWPGVNFEDAFARSQTARV